MLPSFARSPTDSVHEQTFMQALGARHPARYLLVGRIHTDVQIESELSVSQPTGLVFCGPVASRKVQLFELVRLPKTPAAVGNLLETAPLCFTSQETRAAKRSGDGMRPFGPLIAG